MSRGICIVLSILALLLTGCSASRQIETAAIIENVSVHRQNGELVYTFYRLTSGDTPWGVDVRAESFEQACRLAKEAYIPHLSLAKLELLLIEKEVYEDVMESDVDFISTQPSFSPIAYVTLCDAETMEQIRRTNRVQRVIEEQLILLKKNHPEVSINYLSIFNQFAREDGESFTVPLVSSEKELKVSEFEIIPKK
ncbi:MAG: hypothetical protein II709_07435 [Ruminococcus sp.]|nr:hypothetical protein [uncultured Ruminococcus sp.]MBQ4170304.1 hypothetical protein [Ruminococcus sp.]MBQ4261698.1 hypothetical protein [Ruminococcus sp.]SCX00143.1 hypothetical protein SAMN02910436_00040 [Ruminococcaceae bacterium P7]